MADSTCLLVFVFLFAFFSPLRTRFLITWVVMWVPLPLVPGKNTSPSSSTTVLGGQTSAFPRSKCELLFVSSSTFFVLTSWLVFLGLVSVENSPKDQVETTINLVNEELEELNSRFERVRGFFCFSLFS